MVSILKGNDGRLRNGWWILIFYLTLASLVLPMSIHASSRHLDIGPALQALLAGIATGICLALRRDRVSSVAGDLGNWRTGIPVGFLLAAVIWGSSALAIWMAGAVEWHWAAIPFRVPAQAATDCLAVAVVEELVFRGFAFQRLVAGVGVWPAQLAMGAYFVLTHSEGIAGAGELQWLASANVFMASLMLGTAYLKTGSLALPMALHFALNFLQGTVLGFGVSGHQGESLWIPTPANGSHWWHGGDFGLEASIPGTLAIALALAVLLVWRSRPPASLASNGNGEAAQS